jgi:hypothetical protein
MKEKISISLKSLECFFGRNDYELDEIVDKLK